mmetsp:Transcript_10892/g.19403  ORF Transcript_10892/g.19403 Transcript_10892/m.19403 type:complete len:291 (+) Transcript_10892:374-1246(+)
MVLVVRATWLAIFTVCAAVVLQQQLVLHLQLYGINFSRSLSSPDFTSWQCAINLPSLATAHDVTEVLGIPVGQGCVTAAVFLVAPSPNVVVDDTSSIKELYDFLRGGGGLRGKAFMRLYEQLKQTLHVLQGEEAAMRCVRAFQELLVVKWHEREHYPLEMQLVLRRWQVETTNNVVTHHLLCDTLSVNKLSPVFLFQKSLGGFPGFFLQVNYKALPRYWIAQKPPPVRNVAVARQGIEVTRRHCKHIIVNDDIRCLPSDRDGQGELHRAFNAKDETHHDVLCLCYRHFFN